MTSDIEIATAIEHHRLYHVKMFELPDDSSEADQARFNAEIREQYPIHGLIVVNYVSPDKVNGGLLYPEGRKLDPGETWALMR